MKNRFLFALPLVATLALPMVAQQPQGSSDQQPVAQSQSADPNSPMANPDKQLEPLKPDTREGFWGHLNPFARKKYVQRQLAPIRDRANELDELTALVADVVELARGSEPDSAGEDELAAVAGTAAPLASRTYAISNGIWPLRNASVFHRPPVPCLRNQRP